MAEGSTTLRLPEGFGQQRPETDTWSWIDGGWHAGNVAIMGVRSHGAWLGSTVFDGARAFEGVMPDLDRHCERVNRSALALGLAPTMRPEEIAELAAEGLERFPVGTALYIRPMYWAENDGLGVVMPDHESTRFCLTMYVASMPQPTGGSLTLSRYRRPTLECMPTNAKAGCLYPNNARALREAKEKGFDNAIVLDMLGNVAETAASNIFLVKDGVVATPVPNGTFLAGITRTRVIELLRGAGKRVEETVLTYADFLAADEVFTSGNYSKVAPVTRIDGQSYQPGPVAQLARGLYWEFAHQ
jgi:branched-chain amino acid aminotransferase